MNPIIKRLIPNILKEKMISFALNQMKERWYKADEDIKRYELSNQHYQNLKGLGNREDLLHVLKPNATIAEIGVFKGDFSKQIINISSPKKLHLIDQWGSEQFPNSLHAAVKDRFSKNIKTGQVEINKGDSISIASNFKNNYFDWIYLDTAHTYKITIQELEAYKPKMKKGGIIAGHDFILGNWNEMIRYGVKEAVYEFCYKNNWEILYLTMENKEHPSFAIREII